MSPITNASISNTMTDEGIKTWRNSFKVGTGIDSTLIHGILSVILLALYNVYLKEGMIHVDNNVRTVVMATVSMANTCRWRGECLLTRIDLINK